MLKSLKDRLQLCTELLQGLCRPPAEQQKFAGKFYLEQVMYDVRHRHQMRIDDTVTNMYEP